MRAMGPAGLKPGSGLLGSQSSGPGEAATHGGALGPEGFASRPLDLGPEIVDINGPLGVLGPRALLSPGW